MKPSIVKILSVEAVTHNVRRFKIQRPAGLNFVPGQAADVSINTPAFKEQKRPFTFTGLEDWDHLEFTIKIYNDHHGVTEQLGLLKAGDELILHDVFGAIHYYGEGMFIAGGAGVTPFIAIFRKLQKDGNIGANKLLFSNSTEKDIILRDEFTQMLGANFINTITQEVVKGMDHRKIDAVYLKEKAGNLGQYFYICGPDAMVEDIKRDLLAIGAANDRVIIEQF